MFQSTRPRGARPSRRSHLSHKSNVSIHAPAWGATSNSHHSYYILISFNPRARVGRDKIKKAMVKQYGKFQSTRPRGARQIKFTIWIDDKGFQSTRPRGARPVTPAHTTTPRTFQSTRPRGARLTCPCLDNYF